MNATSVDRIRRCYAQMTPHLPRILRDVYDHLFAARPDLRPLFTGDMDAQRNHLAAALALIVRNLHMLDTLEPPLRELGAGHARVGVRPEHYRPLADAVVTAIARAVADAWSPELAADWHALLATVSRHMIAGARP